jgi:hypothetical protein
VREAAFESVEGATLVQIRDVDNVAGLAQLVREEQDTWCQSHSVVEEEYFGHRFARPLRTVLACDDAQAFSSSMACHERAFGLTQAAEGESGHSFRRWLAMSEPSA